MIVEAKLCNLATELQYQMGQQAKTSQQQQDLLDKLATLFDRIVTGRKMVSFA